MNKSTDNLDKKIEAQLEKLKQLKAQKQAIEARERTKKTERKSKIDNNFGSMQKFVGVKL